MYLTVAGNQALLLIDRIAHTLSEKPIYYQECYFQTDRMVYQLMVERSPGARQKRITFCDFSPVFNGENA